MQKHSSFLILFFLFFAVSCSNEVYGLLDRTTQDPFADVPSPSFYEYSTGIQVAWKVDPAADEYYLYRANQSASPTWVLVYQGTQAQFFDSASTLLVKETAYFYQLIKRRGQKFFSPLASQYDIGAFGLNPRDPLGNNDNQAQAIVVGNYSYPDTIYYYNYVDPITSIPHVKSDVDWFVANVPKNLALTIRVSYTGSSTPSSSPSVTLTLHDIHNGIVYPLAANTQNYVFNNNTANDVQYYFSIDYEPAAPGSGNIWTIPYKVEYFSLTTATSS